MLLPTIVDKLKAQGINILEQTTISGGGRVFLRGTRRRPARIYRNEVLAALPIKHVLPPAVGACERLTK